jgi:hypothetical protein
MIVAPGSADPALILATIPLLRVDLPYRPLGRRISD